MLPFLYNLLPTTYVVRGEGNVLTRFCLSVHGGGGGTCLGRRGVGVPTLAGGGDTYLGRGCTYLGWRGGTYLGWRGWGGRVPTLARGEVPALAGGVGTYLGRRGVPTLLPWPKGGYLPTPPPVDCHAVVGMPLAFTQEDFLVMEMNWNWYETE